MWFFFSFDGKSTKVGEALIQPFLLLFLWDFKLTKKLSLFYAILYLFCENFLTSYVNYCFPKSQRQSLVALVEINPDVYTHNHLQILEWEAQPPSSFEMIQSNIW
jgi:hypothetical protein